MRRVRRAADAVGAQLGLANLGMDAKDQFDRVGKVELEIEVTGLAVGVLGNLPECIRDLCGNPADRAEQVPVQLEQALSCAVQTCGDDLVGIKPEPLGQGKRPDASDLLGRAGGKVVGQVVDNHTIHATLDQTVQEQLQALRT